MNNLSEGYVFCCNCGGVNELTKTASDSTGIYETETECKDCGKSDFWAYGSYQSQSAIYEDLSQ